MKGERQAYDAELNKDGFGNMVEYTKLFQAFGKAKQKRDKTFGDQGNQLVNIKNLLCGGQKC